MAYKNGFEALHAVGGNVAIPSNYLVAHALECALKAFLSRDGDDARLRQPDIRHNLTELWTLSGSEGLTLESPVPDWVERLGSLYGAPYHLRYATGVNGLVMPNSDVVVAGARYVIDLVWLEITGSPHHS